MNIFHHSAEFIAKHKRHHHLALATLALIIASAGVYNYRHEFAQAATFTWTQNLTNGGWGGGISALTASHSVNGDSATPPGPWSKYSATSTNIVASGSGVSLAATSYSFTDDSATSSTSGITSGGGFLSSGVATSSTVVSAGSVGLGIAILATGGNTITTAGLYVTHKFTSNGTFTATGNISNAEYLVVAGGGGGGSSGNYNGSGGGAGGFATNTIATITQGSAYSVTIGPSTPQKTVGNDSSFGLPTTITAKGGGFGGIGASSIPGGNGGSGGGGDIGYVGTALILSPMQGHNGGTLGGGGAGAAAISDVGGNGLQWPAGSGVYYAGGGGAQSSLGGSGGGGNGWAGGGSKNGTANTGGGGGGCGNTSVCGGAGGSGVVIVRYSGYALSGTFTSDVINLGAKVATPTLSWVTGGTGTITMEYATSTDNNNWSAYSAITNGGNINGASAGIQYVKYRATLSGDGTTTPTLNDVTINYSQYAFSGNLTSSKYDIGSDAVVSKITWTASTSTFATTTFQMRSSADGATWTNWCGPSTVCDGTDYFQDANNGVSFVSNHPLNSGTGANADRYFQYKVFLGSGGAVSPTLTSVTVQYVVNAPPVVGNVVTSGQISDPEDANYGKVTFTYDVSDVDTVGGATPNSVTPTLYEYYNGTSWATISSGLSANAYTAITLTGNSATSTSPTIIWTPPAGIAYTAVAKIRATVTDGETANFSGAGTSGTFTLDTTVPVISATSVDSSGASDTVTFTATDSSALSYRLCNASCVSEAWTTGITSGVANNITYALAGAPSAETVYIQARDAYGNLSAIASVTAPATPTNFLNADTSNPAANSFGETLSWLLVPGATSYKIYYATTTSTTVTPSAYTLLASPGNTNVYAHNITTATTSAYWYKVEAIITVSGVDNISNFATLPGDVPDSFGNSLADTTAPSILTVAASSILSTSAVVTVTTDELAAVQVFYGTANNGASCNLYGASTPISTLYSTSTSVSLTGLTNATTYHFCVKARDIMGNISTGTYGGFFLTVTGPSITTPPSGTTTDTTAVINWTTSTSSDSYLTYSLNSNLAGGTRVGVSTYTMTLDGSGNYAHAITITGLTAGTRYYYQVESSDSNGTTIDKTTTPHYYFDTTIDTTPPVITGIDTPVKSANAAVIVWQTSELATSQVQWGTASSTYTRSTIKDNTKSIYHIVTLSASTNDMTSLPQDLLPETTYHFIVKSDDTAGNQATSADNALTTPSTGSVVVTVVNVVNTAGDTTKDTTPPSISNVTVSDITPFGATVKFGTSEDANAFVKYGKDISYSDIAGDDTWGTTHTVKLHGLTLGTEYHLKVASQDKAGNTGTSADQTFKTTFLSENLKDMANVENIEQFQKEIESAIESILPSLVPPFVTKPIVSDITESGATISFKTNIKAFPVVVYAEYGAYDETKDNPYTGEVSDTTEKATSHELALTGLKGNTKYHVQARGFSLPKVIGKSADVTFITKASKIAGSIVERKKDSFTVVWTTDEPTTSIVEFKDLKRGITERKVDEAKKTSHSMKIENLPSGTAYEVNLSGMTEQGNIAEAGSPLSVTTSTDTTPPGISGFKVDNALVPGRTDRIQTIVSWMTDEPANSTVYFEEGAGTAGDTTELANKNESLDSYVTGHSIILPSLKPGTIYRLKVTSSDDSGNLGSFGPRTVITPKQTESITDIIFKNFEDSFKFMRKI